MDSQQRQAHSGWMATRPYVHVYIDSTRHLERNGMPHFPKDLDYSNIYGQDLEHDVEAWQNTTAFLGMKDHHRMKAMELICQEIGLYYDLSSVSGTDKGPMAQLIRIQEMYKAAQRRVIAAGQQLEEALGMVTRAFPRNADEIRHQESLMRKLIILEERSKYAQPDDRDSYWADRFMKNLLRSGGADEFANEGTRTHTIQRLLSLQQYGAQGQKVTTSEVWQAVRTAYVQVNGGEGENLSGMLQGFVTLIARAMLARPPLGDRNGRDTGYVQGRQLPSSGAGEGGPDGKSETALSHNEALRRLADTESQLAAANNTIAQTRANAEKFKASRKADFEKRQAARRAREDAKTDGAGAAQVKKTGPANTGPAARGCCLRTSPGSDDDSDRPVENHARLFLLRENNTIPVRTDVNEFKQDAPQSPLPLAPQLMLPPVSLQLRSLPLLPLNPRRGPLRHAMAQAQRAAVPPPVAQLAVLSPRP